MTILEMHIAIDLLLQKVNSNVISSIGDEEKDFLINNEIIRFINSRTRPQSDEKRLGFQGDIKRYEDLKALIKTKSLPVYSRDARSVFGFIPSDCFRLIKDRSVTKDLCGNPYVPTTVSEDVYYVTYKFLNSGVNDYENFVYKLDGVTVFDSSQYPQFAGGIPTPEMKFELIQFMMEEIRKAGYEVKYENFRGKFYRESIIVCKVSTVAFSQTVTYNGGAPVITNATADVYTKITGPIGSGEYDNELLPTNKYNDYLNSAFGTTFYYAPISTLEIDQINVFHKQKFIVSSLSIDYIRIPRKVSLPLNQSCDLDENVHQEIVDNLAKRLAAITSAEQYQQLLRENLLKE